MRITGRLRRVVIGAALSLVIATSGCHKGAATLLGGDGVSRRGRTIFEEQTGVRSEEFVVLAADLPREFCVCIRVRTGAVEWRLLGSDGSNAQGSGEAEGNRVYQVSYCMELAPGKWELLLDLDKAAGEYEVGWYEPGSEPAVATHLYQRESHDGGRTVDQ